MRNMFNEYLKNSSVTCSYPGTIKSSPLSPKVIFLLCFLLNKLMLHGNILSNHFRKVSCLLFSVPLLNVVPLLLFSNVYINVLLLLVLSVVTTRLSTIF